MNQSQVKNESLLSMLPPEVQKQVLLLIKRLGDEKLAKQQFQMKCQLYEKQVDELRQEVEKLRKENQHLKERWQSSFSMISKVRENFSGSKKNTSEQLLTNQKKQLKFNMQHQNCNQSSEQDSVQNHPQNILQNKHIPKTSHQHKNYFTISSPNPILQKSSIQKLQPENLPPTTAKKPHKNQESQSVSFINQGSSRSKFNNKSSKKEQISSLKQQIQKLTSEIKTKETTSMSLAEKMRRCEEIKSRYKKGTNPNTSGHDSSLNIQSNDTSLILNSYHSPKKNTKQQQKSILSSQLSLNSQASLKQYEFTQQKYQLKQNIPQNQNMITRGNMMMNNSSMMRGVKASQQNNNEPSTKSMIKKQPMQQSFYDDGLLDLIEEMNS